VRGYPDITYGVDQCNPEASPPNSPSLPLPIKLDAIPPDLIGTTSYDASQTTQVTFDVSYDLWLNSDAATTCQRDGTVEIMVWTDYSTSALLPPELQVGSPLTIPFASNGTVNPGTGAWSAYASNIHSAGETAATGGTVWLLLNSADAVASGTISVDLSSVFSAVGNLLQSDYGWSNVEADYWLDTIPFGMEFGPQPASVGSTGPSNFSWNVSSDCLDVGMTLASATCS
jgi:hypothetical protein